MTNNDLKCDKCGCQHHPVDDCGEGVMGDIETIILDVQEEIEKENGHIVLLQSHRRRIAKAIVEEIGGSYGR